MLLTLLLFQFLFKCTFCYQLSETSGFRTFRKPIATLSGYFQSKGSNLEQTGGRFHGNTHIQDGVPVLAVQGRRKLDRISRIFTLYGMAHSLN